MNYFQAISKRCNELTEKANTYLEMFDDGLSNDEMIQKIFDKSVILMNEAKERGEDFWETLPDWATSSLDYAVPFSNIPINGSLYFSLGFSIAAFEANLRILYEYVMDDSKDGNEELEFFVALSEKDIVDSYTDDD